MKKKKQTKKPKPHQIFENVLPFLFAIFDERVWTIHFETIFRSLATSIKKKGGGKNT